MEIYLRKNYKILLKILKITILFSHSFNSFFMNIHLKKESVEPTMSYITKRYQKKVRA